MGLFGRASGLVATREQEEESRRIEEMLGRTPPGYGASPGMPVTPSASQGGGLADRLGNLGTSLMAAQASFDGDFSTASQITGLQQQRAAAARKQAEEAAQRQQMMAALQKQNLTPEQAQLVIGGAASYGDVHPKAPEPTEQQRNFDAYDHMTPEQRQAFGSYQDVVNPRFTNTPAGTQFIPRSATGGWQSQYDPKEWEPIAGPPPQQGAPAAPQAQPSFTPDATNMQRLYQQQFGPQQGQAMFQEWLRNSRHGGR